MQGRDGTQEAPPLPLNPDTVEKLSQWLVAKQGEIEGLVTVVLYGDGRVELMNAPGMTLVQRVGLLEVAKAIAFGQAQEAARQQQLGVSH